MAVDISHYCCVRKVDLYVERFTTSHALECWLAVVCTVSLHVKLSPKIMHRMSHIVTFHPSISSKRKMMSLVHQNDVLDIINVIYHFTHV